LPPDTFVARWSSSPERGVSRPIFANLTALLVSIRRKIAAYSTN
jgi:hypothetical protein